MVSAEPKQSGDGGKPWSALRFAWELGYLIAIPVVVFAVGGALADRWLGTKPWLLVFGVLVSIVITTVSVTIKAIRIMSDRSQTESSDHSDEEKTTK